MNEGKNYRDVVSEVSNEDEHPSDTCNSDVKVDVEDEDCHDGVVKTGDEILDNKDDEESGGEELSPCR